LERPSKTVLHDGNWHGLHEASHFPCRLLTQGLSQMTRPSFLQLRFFLWSVLREDASSLHEIAYSDSLGSQHTGELPTHSLPRRSNRPAQSPPRQRGHHSFWHMRSENTFVCVSLAGKRTSTPKEMMPPQLKSLEAGLASELPSILPSRPFDGTRLSKSERQDTPHRSVSFAKVGANLPEIRHRYLKRQH